MWQWYLEEGGSLEMNEIWKEELVDLCRGAIQLPSPFGQEKEITDYVVADRKSGV